MPINLPSNQKKLTNVSYVRIKKGKKRFEIACYQNKVQDWRKGIEKNLDDVLQIPQVFTNVSKGQIAPHADLKAAFGTTDTNEIILEILKKGELQLGEKERQAQASQVHAEILNMVSSKCVNPNTKRPYPSTMIDKVLTELGFNMAPSKSAKILALDAMKLLISKQIIPIARATMRIRITNNAKESKKWADKVKALASEVEEENWGMDWECLCVIDPGRFREVNELVKDQSKGKGSIEVLDVAVIKEGEETF
ncbi:Shwachman-Bodian-diamond syndrome protein [Nadsonia fulvescens var. elongata DSM 6958]|uniref:Ribosome maturation protein SDO1 n=1 Tax=Nadsonia fulvescens var. elongata DSM 6958 TaxID=857566 RepID=A0A1E3PD67_9ASCO|nr:Shwachman-Bodian-diamond syndrome protein [Nadsonia fulvescens var. elongata DSM 6958]